MYGAPNQAIYSLTNWFIKAAMVGEVRGIHTVINWTIELGRLEMFQAPTGDIKIEPPSGSAPTHFQYRRACYKRRRARLDALRLKNKFAQVFIYKAKSLPTPKSLWLKRL